VRFEFGVAGDKLISRDLVRLGERGVNALPAFEQIGEQFARTEKRRFDTDGNGTWQPLSTSTIAFKARHGLDPRILRATGALRASLISREDPAHIRIAQPQSLVFGTLVEYAKYHQKGRGVPVRKPLGFTENAKREAVKTIQRYVLTGSVK
jgi:phage gpG-like protein